MTLRNDIEEIIKNFKNIPEEDHGLLITLSLHKIFKSDYFKNSYANSFIIRDIEDNYWLSTGNMSSLGMSGITGVISSPRVKDDFESQFAYEGSVKILEDIDLLRINKIYNEIKNGKNLNQISKSINEIIIKDRESLFLFNSIFYAEINTNEFYKNVVTGVDIEDCSSNLYKNEIFQYSYDSEKARNLIAEDSFLEERSILISKLDQRMKLIESSKEILEKNSIEINKVLNEIYKIHPELNFVPSKAEDLKFYFIESVSPNPQNSSYKSIFSKNEVIAIGQSDLNFNVSDFENFYCQNRSLKDFLNENPFSYSEYNQIKVNEIEGLKFLGSESLYVDDYNSKYFIVAKTKKMETVSILVLSKNNEYKNTFKISAISVKNSYRGLGVARKMYEKLSSLAVKNKMIIKGGHYTPDGRTCLASMKMDVIRNSDGLVMIDESRISVFDCKMKSDSLSMFNKHSLIKVNQLETSRTLKYESFSKGYLKGLELIANADINKYENGSELCNNAYKILENEITKKEKSLKLKLKQ